ncbi:MAG: Arcadin 1 protein [Thermoproteota archaeon]|nr:Arcadin 1 protein [Thermoproteota archaeon]
MSEITFTIRVTAIHPSYDNQGNEYISVEFGYRPPTMPTMIPTNVSREVSDMIEASRGVVKVMVPPQIQAQWKVLANRLILFLTPEEWENLQQKYTVSDEFTVALRPDGNITIKKM